MAKKREENKQLTAKAKAKPKSRPKTDVRLRMDHSVFLQLQRIALAEGNSVASLIRRLIAEDLRRRNREGGEG